MGVEGERSPDQPQCSCLWAQCSFGGELAYVSRTDLEVFETPPVLNNLVIEARVMPLPVRSLPVLAVMLLDHVDLLLHIGGDVLRDSLLRSHCGVLDALEADFLPEVCEMMQVPCRYPRPWPRR